MRAFLSEWSRLMRPGVLLGAAGTIVGSALLICGILFATADRDPATGPTVCDVQDHPELAAEYARAHPQEVGAPAKQTLPYCTLTKPTGMALPFSFAGQLIGIVALVLFAQNLGAEYSHGTLKSLLAREPRRLHLLLGKALALALLVTLAILAAFLLQSLLAAVLASARGISATAWYGPKAIESALLLLARVVVGSWAWGVIGLLLAILLRASAAAIGIGIGYTVVAEPIVSLAFNRAAKYLPGRTLQSFVSWGASPQAGQPPGLEGPVAAVMLVVYAGVMLALALTLFKSRDVAG